MALQLLSVIESPRHPNFSQLYDKLGITHTAVTSIRKALKSVKANPPDILVAEFIYGYGNNYAGVNISNLDVLLVSLKPVIKQTHVILFCDKRECEYIKNLEKIHPVTASLTLPVNSVQMQNTLAQLL